MRLIATGALLAAGYAAMTVIVSIRLIDTLEREQWNSVERQLSNDSQANHTAAEDGIMAMTALGSASSLQKPQQQLAMAVSYTVVSPADSPSLRDGRFPKYGTAEFSRQCAWTSYRGNTRNCTIMARPVPGSREGLGQWIPQIVMGHMLAQQAGCNLVFDYGSSVDIHEIFTPSTTSRRDWNWTVPRGYDCESDTRCFWIMTTDQKNMSDQLKLIGTTVGTDLAAVPFYRFAYSPVKVHFLYRNDFRDLERALPGIQGETGMACSLASLLHLSPSISQFEPNLFSKILPTLNRKDSLVVAVYVRTGETDSAGMKKGRSNATVEEDKNYRERAKNILDCALQQERQHLNECSFSRVVWVVLTDSPDLKKWIAESYDTTSANARSLPSNVTREIVTTGSRGVHTKLAWGPTNVDFAEAFIDWYLIGESDFVVTDGGSPSFGGTAALRTARPLYDATKGACVKGVPIHENVSPVTTRYIKKKTANA